MKFLKKIFKKPKIQNILAWIAAQYLIFVYKTTKWNYYGTEHIEPYIRNNKTCIVAFWHNRLMMCPFAWQYDKPFSMLISGHSDGLIISKIIHYFNLKTIFGSKSKGGFNAIKNLLNSLKNGHYIGITPDGPRGPRFNASEGIISVARISKCDIVPLCYNVKRRKIINSWDKFLVPLPFNQGIIAWGNPFNVSKFENISADQITMNFNLHMQELADFVDHYCGHEEMR